MTKCTQLEVSCSAIVTSNFRDHITDLERHKETIFNSLKIQACKLHFLQTPFLPSYHVWRETRKSSSTCSLQINQSFWQNCKNDIVGQKLPKITVSQTFFFTKMSIPKLFSLQKCPFFFRQNLHGVLFRLTNVYVLLYDIYRFWHAFPWKHAIVLFLVPTTFTWFTLNSKWRRCGCFRYW